MLTAERRRETQRLLRLRGELDYVWLAEHFGVSEMTARRDVESLEAAGEARRVRGGAISVVSRGYEPSVSERETVGPRAKDRISAAAAAMLRPGDTLFLDSGTTANIFAGHLAALDMDLLVVTPNLRAALTLSDALSTRVILTGGLVRRQERSLVGADAERTLQRYNVDTAFVGAAGVHPERGLTDYGLEESEVKRIAIARATRVVALADRSKLGRISLCEICPSSEIDVLVTDAPVDHTVVRELAQTGTEIVSVHMPEPDPLDPGPALPAPTA